ncbi:uncharacterized protein [Aegilops tauschii subsp. strangulata]|uniref:uncharacterized protein isoform X5 n=1 Tax=Aegilops tauschii subsp. strangulata TaxID=200361 RepID=UPI003CC8D26E
MQVGNSFSDLRVQVGMMLRMGWEDVCVCASCFTYDSEKELLCSFRLPTSRISYLWSGATKQFMRFPPWTPPRSWAPPPPTRAPTGSTGWASPSWASATTAASSPLTLRTSTERFHDFGLAIIKIGGEPDALESIIREFHRIELRRHYNLASFG